MRTLISRFSILLTLCFVFCATPVLGCFCRPDWAKKRGADLVKDAYNSSSAVFAGKVTDIKPAGRIGVFNYLEVTVAVKTVWKSHLQEYVKVLTRKDEAACGFTFQVGKNYLIYADENPSKTSSYYTGQCTRTKLHSKTKDLKQLNRINRPTPPSKNEVNVNKLSHIFYPEYPIHPVLFSSASRRLCG